jgi:uncharacterized membrane protein YfcA
MAATRMQPRFVIGTVSASEFLVTAGASAGFILGLGTAGVAWGAVAALLAGGLIAAPIAAWIVRRVDYRTMGAAVATMILFSNSPRVLELVGVGPNTSQLVANGIALIGAGLTLGLWIGRRTPAPGSSDAPAPMSSDAPPVGASA